MKITIYKNKFGGFNAPANNGETKAYMSIQFKKGQEPEMEEIGHIVDISDGFFSNYEKKDGTIVPKLVVMECTDLGEITKGKKDELPF